MQQVSKHTLRALILSALLTTSGMAFAATPAQTPSANPAQHTVTTTATVQDTTATAQDKTAAPTNTVVNQQLRSGRCYVSKGYPRCATIHLLRCTK